MNLWSKLGIMLFLQAEASEGPDFHKGKPFLCFYFNACLTFHVHPQVHVCSSTHKKIGPRFWSPPKHHFALLIFLWVLGLQTPPTPHKGPLTTNSRCLWSTQLFTVTSARGQVKWEIELSWVETHVAQSTLVTGGKWVTSQSAKAGLHELQLSLRFSPSWNWRGRLQGMLYSCQALFSQVQNHLGSQNVNNSKV